MNLTPVFAIIVYKNCAEPSHNQPSAVGISMLHCSNPVKLTLEPDSINHKKCWLIGGLNSPIVAF